MILTDILLLQGQNGLMSLVPLLLMVPVFYFFMIRPQQKRQKEQQSFSDSLQKGAQVVTTGGIIGRINRIEANVITLEVDTKTYIRVARNFISREMTESFANNSIANETPNP